MITYGGKIITGLTGKWVIPNHAFDITYSTVPNGSFSGPSTAYGGETVTVTSTPGSGYLLDYITVNGVAIQGNTFTMPYGNVTISGAFKVNYNPLNLPPFTIRLLYKDGVVPGFSYGTGVQVSESPNVWDLTFNDPYWSQLLDGHTDLLKVLGANSSGVLDLGYAFASCTSLTDVELFDISDVTVLWSTFSRCINLKNIPLFDTHNVETLYHTFYACSALEHVPLFDTSNCANFIATFYECGNLKEIPLFNTSKVVNMDYTFIRCTNVESGALALYNQLSSLPEEPSHSYTFNRCGQDTVTGAAELAQIPSDWK